MRLSGEPPISPFHINLRTSNLRYVWRHREGKMVLLTLLADKRLKVDMGNGDEKVTKDQLELL